jgi:hypothetical protein
MRIKVLSIVVNIITEGDVNLQLYNIRFSNSKSVINNKITKDFTAFFGSVNVTIVKNRCCFVWEGEANTFPIFTFQQDSGLPSLAVNLDGIFSSVLSSLWFIKDSSVYTYKTFVESTSGKKDGFFSVNNPPLTLSNGEDKPSPFTLDELKQGLEIFKKLDTFYNEMDKDVMLANRLFNRNKATANPADIKPYVHSRTARSMYLLKTLRSEPNPIVKITYHIAIYECLFLSADIEICKHLRARISRFLGRSNTERKVIKNLISKAYDIRSRYIHGDSLHLTLDVILKISKQVDELSRTILNKILNMQDNHLFTQSETPNSIQEFEEYFNSLVDSQATSE